jgi:hypothetical protein
MSITPITQWDDQNAKHQLKVMAFNILFYAGLIEFLVFCSSHQV